MSRRKWPFSRGRTDLVGAASYALSELNRLIVVWRASFGLGFRTGLGLDLFPLFPYNDVFLGVIMRVF